MNDLVSTASLLFAVGQRPGAADIRALAAQLGTFTISFDPSQEGSTDEGWVELLANGLTFDLTGLAPHQGEENPPSSHSYGLPEGGELGELEAITLRPGPHLSAGGAMFPVVRSLAHLTAQLTQLSDAQAVVWRAANCRSEPEYFRRGVFDWIEGGVFPGLGLTALAPTSDGGMQSEGLSLFTGQELLLPPAFVQDNSDAPKIALRLINWLVEHGRIVEPQCFAGPSGESLALEPVDNSRVLRVWKGSL